MDSSNEYDDKLPDTSSCSRAWGEFQGPGWTEIREQQAWDDYLAWCKACENGPHE